MHGPLVHSSIFLLEEGEPVFLRHITEGDVAYWGMILSAFRDAKTCDYLVSKAKEGLWEFHSGFGVTSADSALVIEGLLANGYDQHFIEKSVERLVEAFYVDTDGGFQTVHSGRAKYWEGVSLEVTAQIGWILSRVDANRWRRQIAACLHFVMSAHRVNGLWTGKWFPSQIIPTYYAVRFLMLCGNEEARLAANKACAILESMQSEKGGWSNLVIDTAAATLALEAAAFSPSAVEKAREWISAVLKVGRESGEPVLYYWYEDVERGKTLFVGRDFTGKIAKAWARLALQKI